MADADRQQGPGNRADLAAAYRSVLENAGVTIFEDRAVLKDAHTVRLAQSGRDVTAETILIATGGRPSREIGGEAR